MVIVSTRLPFKGLKREQFQEKFFFKRTDPDNETQIFIDIASAIIQQAVEDEKYLQSSGEDKTRYLSQPIDKGELLNFFYSDWFEFLLSYALPQFTPEDIFNALHIKEKGTDHGNRISEPHSEHQHYLGLY